MNGQVALLVARLALGIRLGAFDRQAVQDAGVVQQVAVVGHAPGVIEIRHFHVGGDHRVQVRQHGAVRCGGRIFRQPGAEVGVLHVLDGGDVLACKAVHQALRLFHDVVDRLDHAGVAHIVGRVAHGGGGDHGEIGLHACHAHREIAVARGADLRRQLVAAGAARVAGQQHRIAVFQAGGGDHQEVLRVVRHVVRRRSRPGGHPCRRRRAGRSSRPPWRGHS